MSGRSSWQNGNKATSRPSPLSLRSDYFDSESSADHESEEQDIYHEGQTQQDTGSMSPASAPSDSFSIVIPSDPTFAQTAFTALQYLPVPVLVLGSLKTAVLANEAMGRLINLETNQGVEEIRSKTQTTTDALLGQTLSQIGVDMMQNGIPVWVNWEDFLETIGEETVRKRSNSGELTPTLKDETNPTWRSRTELTSSKLDRTTVHDVAVDVVLSPERCSYASETTKTDKDKDKNKNHAAPQVLASMIVSVWWVEESKFYTLTFVGPRQIAEEIPSPKFSTSSGPVSHSSSRSVPKTTRTYNNSPGSSSSASSEHRSSSSPASTVSSPSAYIPTFPPSAPPSRVNMSAPSILQKATKLRDALLNSMSLPCYAIWKDQSVGIPNEALMKLSTVGSQGSGRDGADFLASFVAYKEDFSRPLEMEEYPIVKLLNTQQRSTGNRFGLKDPRTGAPKVFDANCEVVLDDDTGEFLGGIVIMKDITDYVDRIAAQKNLTHQQFVDVCDRIPPMVWTTTPDGSHDYFNIRWYEYTGLSVEESLGEGWRHMFHPDDMPVTAPKWAHSLTTGDEYVTEYRCRRRDGAWRWFLGRALPLRDEKGVITRWFGTCTDIHEAVMARETANRTREQLLRVIETAKVTLCTIDMEQKITLLEGSMFWRDQEASHGQQLVGLNIFDVFEDTLDETEVASYRRPVEAILAGLSTDEFSEWPTKQGRWYRMRYLPLLQASRDGGVEGEKALQGCIIVTTDVTELRKRENDLRSQEKQNSKLIANAIAAKEASRMKSQFLANMSHEIRTPIAGVIGMSELLADMNLNEEQTECAENIQRSANGLLTVINDILDFSKVESGRLDIEEVQFSLSVVIRDVNKMLSFAATRKNLSYETNVEAEIKDDLRVMGDPGRLRQILTNVLTNSIKFTSEGSVTLNAKVQSETSDTISVAFTVQDTGIGIEEEVRKRLFTPFSQADSSTARRYGGTGLGLTISKNLVNLMHGDITLESKLGVGTVAKFWIPFKKAEYMPKGSPLVDLGAIPDRLQSDMSVSISSEERTLGTPPPSAAGRRGSISAIRNTFANAGATGSVWGQHAGENHVSLSEAERRAIHVLVVEDNQINQQIALKTIKKLKFSANAVWNGKEAVEYVFGEPSSDRPKPDIILMDVQMPILDGYKATQVIRQRLHDDKSSSIGNVPIVAMTASAIRGDKEKCQKAGMDDYLAKPVKGKVLEKMLIKWAIEGRRRASSTAKSDSQSKNQSTPLSLDVDEGSLARNDSNPDSMPSSFDTQDGREQFAKDSALAHLTETEEAGRIRRAEAEEKAMFLRDDKLLSMAEDPRVNRHQAGEVEPHSSSHSGTHALTSANMDKFVEAQQEAEESEGMTKSTSMTVKSHRSRRSESPGPRRNQPHLSARRPSLKRERQT